MVLSGAESYRMIWGYFYSLTLVQIEHSEGRSELLVKSAQGASDWRPAVQTIRRRSRALSESEWLRVRQAMHEYGFWDQPVMKSPDGKLPAFDGMSVTLEGVDSGKRHVIWRSIPDNDGRIRAVVNLLWKLADCRADKENN